MFCSMRAKLADGGVVRDEGSSADYRSTCAHNNIISYCNVYVCDITVHARVRVCVCGEVVTLTPAGLVNQKTKKNKNTYIIIMYTK